ncbi:MAG: pyrroline-5-carboxylate reductase [Alphaproteobacteria bacterium]|nr:pyrroline-5-carboxylate reductase [Alphaproteobacteria bacterium]MDE1984962.1 pyrroline-5-carboxylate reductase [Alphaproteobacteria bacterium]MDE2162306.1 pyrroline-5-carboxylate reductase [Alphaproteobacteria bacterium]MDE2266032.1 pyrroline-5-carboxylate reductase [Alphaproteobacteria bacterium]MDE2498890.1 pyrroline-5-carboxylate reductase [Alphaproteobacteria bacterium]
MSQPILLIGAGHMGSALIRGWIKAGLGPITAVEPHPSAHLRKLEGPNLVADLRKIPRERWRACVVALKPQVLRAEAAHLKPVAASGTLMISIAAGTSVGFMAQQWGRKAHIVRAMPNMPGGIDRGITALYAASTATARDRTLAKSLLSAIGQTVWLKRESQIDAATAVSGSGPAYIFALVEAMEAAGVAAGLPRATAAMLARATVTGSGALLDADRRDAAELRRDVATPGGTTEAALKILLGKDGLEALMTRAVAAAKARAEELGRG